MPCYRPRSAWQLKPGDPVVWSAPPIGTQARFLEVPCGRCIGCSVRLARDWSIRCVLEEFEHDVSCWATLTYDDKFLPRAGDSPTLDKQHLSGFLKRLRSRVSPQTVRFFGVGEYGDTTARPHYHVILYGLAPNERHIPAAWPFGFARVDPLSPAAIAYVAGYAQKKIGTASLTARKVDPETGEILTPERPFRLVSRRPGIGGAARRHRHNWRSHAVFRGQPVPVPRFLHRAWADVASELDKLELEAEKAEAFPRRSYERRVAGEKIAFAKYRDQTERRSLR